MHGQISSLGIYENNNPGQADARLDDLEVYLDNRPINMAEIKHLDLDRAVFCLETDIVGIRTPAAMAKGLLMQ